MKRLAFLIILMAVGCSVDGQDLVRNASGFFPGAKLINTHSAGEGIHSLIYHSDAGPSEVVGVLKQKLGSGWTEASLAPDQVENMQERIRAQYQVPASFFRFERSEEGLSQVDVVFMESKIAGNPKYIFIITVWDTDAAKTG